MSSTLHCSMAALVAAGGTSLAKPIELGPRQFPGC